MPAGGCDCVPHADGQVGLPADQRLPGAGQHLAAQAQPRAGLAGALRLLGAQRA